jgi:hypothetical protein
MALVKKTTELDQEAITLIKTALNAKSEKCSFGQPVTRSG